MPTTRWAFWGIVYRNAAGVVDGVCIFTLTIRRDLTREALKPALAKVAVNEVDLGREPGGRPTVFDYAKETGRIELPRL